MVGSVHTKLRDRLDRNVALGLFLRRVRRFADRALKGGTREGNIAMLHAGRCGSSVVADLLNQHPEVYWAGELFELMSPIYYCMDSGRRAEELIANALYRRRTRYFGFDSKYLPEQHLRPELANQSVEGYVGLLRRLGFRHFILLGRRNHLRRAVSVAIGTKTGQWNTRGEVRRTTARIDPDRFMSYGTEMPLLHYFRSLDETHARARNALQGQRLLELGYEADIEGDPQVAYRKVCAWLDIAPRAVEVRLRKLNPLPLSDLVDNFEEVERTLRGTPYAWMLQDSSAGVPGP